MTAFAQVAWITNGTTDYRPAIGHDGATVVFERAVSGVGVVLFRVVIGSGQDPEAFLPDLDGVQTRPDWCWATTLIAFDLSSGGETVIYTVGGDGQNAAVVPDTQSYFYPQWDQAGATLTVMNNNNSNPNPCTSVINLSGEMLCANINGTIPSGVLAFGGMPAVNLLQGAQWIAFAGQAAAPEATYHQDKNYIYLNQQVPPTAPLGSSDAVFLSAPMEPGAPAASFNSAYQGRAPAWSPNGRYVVFESNRAPGGYALFLFDTVNRTPSVQLTETSLGSQHAKFFPNGTGLIFGANRNGAQTMSIGTIDISQYVS
jgi:Tol biopolymer transport system component